MRITRTKCNFEREPLQAPFGFKGGYLSEIWQSAVKLESASGKQGLGLGTQSTLWSDAKVFLGNSEAVGNAMMFLATAKAAELAAQLEWDSPMDLLDQLLPQVYDHCKTLTGEPGLRLTFALNALVAVDNAAWVLWCREKGVDNFSKMIPSDVRPALAALNDKLAAIPLASYGVPLPGIVKLVDEGYFLMKIKIGSDPDKDGDQDKMLAWDKERLAQIHAAVKDRPTPHTASGHIPYYLDANGRYDSKDRLLRLLDHAAKIGALERILIVEEPFPEELKVDVSDIPARLAADESAHSDHDALERIQMGYKAIALKPIAKTLSMSFKIAKLAHAHGVPCFCADLTVNPILVDWNKNVAARLAPLPGMKVGVLESNGHQNYRDWNKLRGYHPRPGGSWVEAKDGLFITNDDFFASSGGILETSEHYAALVKN